MDKIRVSWNKLSLGAKSSLGFLVANVLTTGIAYITTPIFTRMLTSEQFGQTSVYLTWQHIFGIIAMFCLSYGVFNNGMLEYKDRREEFSFSLLALSNILTIIFMFIVIALHPLLKKIVNVDIPLLLLMTGFFIFQPAYNFWIAKNRYEYKYKSPLILSSIIAFLSPAVAIICIKIFENKLYARLFGAELVAITFYAGIYYLSGKKVGWKIDFKFWKYALLFNIPLIPHYLSTYLLNSSDKLMISYLINDSATAYYSVAYSIGSVALIVWNAVNGSLIPYTYEKCQQKKYEDINRITIPILFVFALGCILVIMLAPEIVSLMATSEYSEAVYVIPPITAGLFFQIQYFVYANIVYYHKKPVYVMIGSVIAVIFNLILNYIFIRRFGYLAAGYTTLVCYAIQACIDYLAMKKIVGSNVYNMKAIILLSIFIVSFALLCNLFYHLAIVRYVIVLIVFITCYIYRDQIIKAIYLKNVKKEN